MASSIRHPLHPQLGSPLGLPGDSVGVGSVVYGVVVVGSDMLYPPYDAASADMVIGVAA